MRVGVILAAVLFVAPGALAEEHGRPTAILVSPIDAAQVVRGDDGMDHVEYELLVVSVFSEPVTLSSVTVLDPAGKELTQIEGDALAAATQTLFAKTPAPIIPASAAVSVDVDLIVAPGAAPERVRHRIAYSLAPNSENAAMIGKPEVDGVEVEIDRRPPIAIMPPLRGDGWFATSGCCKPNVHRDLRIAIDGRRIATPETFAVDWARVKDGRIFDGDGGKVEEHYAYGEDVLAVADGAVVSIRDGMPDEIPLEAMVPKTKPDFGGNHVMLEIAPGVFALYAHLKPGSVAVKVGDAVTAGTRIASVGNTGPSMGPHLHFGLADKPDFFAGRSLPFVFGSFWLAGAVDFDASKPDLLAIAPISREVESAYPLYGGIQDFR